jgi:hypothetical protein
MAVTRIRHAMGTGGRCALPAPSAQPPTPLRGDPFPHFVGDEAASDFRLPTSDFERSEQC